MDKECAKELDEALVRKRAGFADVSEEQIHGDVAQIIERDREAQRKNVGPLAAMEA